MRPTLRASVLIGLMLSGLTASAYAQTILVQPDPSAGAFVETDGSWVETSTRSSAPDVEQVGASRLLKPGEDGTLKGSAEYRPLVPMDGEYSIQLTWSGESNARGVTVIVKGPDGTETTKTMDFGPVGSTVAPPNQWAELARLNLTAGSEVTVRIVADTSVGPLNESMPHQLQLDALRLEMVNGEGTASTDGQTTGTTVAAVPTTAPGTQPIAIQADTMAAVPTVTPAPTPAVEDDPFANVETPAAPTTGATASSGATTDSPFLDPDSAAGTSDAVSDPFAGTSGGTTAPDDDFSGAAASAPGSTDGTSAAPADPFASATETSDAPGDPFASSTSSATPADPFAPTATPAAVSSDPFASSASNAAAGNVADPFAPGSSGTAAPDDPFAPTAPASGVAETESPFIVPGSSTASTEDDPFANPVTAAATPAPTPVVGTEGNVATEVNTQFLNTAVQEQPIDLAFRPTIEEAVAAAKESDKRVIVLFSGDSAQAKSFERLLSSDPLDPTMAEFEIVRVDYRQNRPLASKYAVRNFPYIVIVNKYGYTEAHVLPTTSAERLAQQLQPYTQRLF